MSGTVHAQNRLPNGAPAVGDIVITVNTEDQVIRDPAGNLVFQGPLVVKLVNGDATVTLPASDDATLSPTGFTYTVTEQLKHVTKSNYRVVDFQVTDGGTHYLADFASSEEVALDPSYGASLNGALGEIAALRDLSDAGFADALSASTGGPVWSVTDTAYGAVGNGSTNDTAAIQATIDACPDGGTVVLPPGVFKITAALSITKNITIRGQGVNAVWGGRAVAFDSPGVSPYITGSIIEQATAATNAVNITGTGVTVNLYDFGIRFATPIRFTNTGHGVNAVPSATYSGNLEHGLVDARWDNVKVWGHDGNHYAFKLTNFLLCTFSHLRAFGGGLFELDNDSNTGYYGNTTFNNCYGNLIAAGTAHGYHLKGTEGALNLMTFTRPQVNSEDNATFGITATNSQYLFKVSGTGDNMAHNFSVIGGDFETTLSGGSGTWPIDFGAGNRKSIDRVGIYGNKQLEQVNGEFQTATPTITSRPGAGTSPATPTITGDDYHGEFSIPIGSSGAAAETALVRITWSAQHTAYPSLTYFDAYGAVPSFYISAKTSSYIEIAARNVPGASGVYVVGYRA